MINCYLGPIDDPVTMIRSGLLPHPDLGTISLPNIDDDDYEYAYAKYYNPQFVVSLLAQDVPLDQIAWWTNLENVTEALRSVRLWSFYTKEGALQEAKHGNSYASLFAYPELLYSNSRPRTDMTMFRLPRSLTLQTLGEGAGRLLPVTRYATGTQSESLGLSRGPRFASLQRSESVVSKGMYFTEKNTEQKEFCGTFYYLESESATYLRYNTSHVSFSKETAFQELKEKYRELIGSEATEISAVKEHEDMRQFVDKHGYINRGYIAYMTGLLRKDLRYTPSEYNELFMKGLVEADCFQNLIDTREAKFESEEVPIYVGGCPALGLYAAEDMLDQPLCILGKILGIDVIILEYTGGSHRIAAEVLDTRHRDTSFQNLVFT